MRIDLFDKLSILLNYSEFLVRKLFYIDWHEHGSYLYYYKTDLNQKIYEIYESNYKAMQKDYAEKWLISNYVKFLNRKDSYNKII